MTATVLAFPGYPGADKWEEEASHYLARLARRRRSAATIRSYGFSYQSWTAYLMAGGRSLDPRLATEADAEGWVESMGHQKPTTQLTRFVAVSGFFRYLLREEVIERSPFARLDAPSLPREPEVPVVPPADLIRLLDSMRGRSYIDRRDLAMFLFMLDTGARRDEVAGMMVEDIVDLNARQVILYGKGEKSRRVTWGVEADDAMRRYWRLRADHPQADRVESHGPKDAGREGRPFWLAPPGKVGGGLSGQSIYRVLRLRCDRAGIARAHPHQLRHTWAHVLKLEGTSTEDMMRLGGWSSPSMVARYGASESQSRALANYRSPMDRLLTSTRKGTNR